MLNNGNGFSVQGVRATALFWMKKQRLFVVAAGKAGDVVL
jgi:hypothetical protein